MRYRRMGPLPHSPVRSVDAGGVHVHQHFVSSGDGVWQVTVLEYLGPAMLHEVGCLHRCWSNNCNVGKIVVQCDPHAICGMGSAIVRKLLSTGRVRPGEHCSDFRPAEIRLLPRGQPQGRCRAKEPGRSCHEGFFSRFPERLYPSCPCRPLKAEGRVAD